MDRHTIAMRDLPRALKSLIGSRKRSVTLWVTDTHTVRPSMWDGGSRDITEVVDATTLQRAPIPAECQPEGWPRCRSGEPLSLGARIVLVTGTFMGKESTPALHMTEVTAKRWGLV